MISYPGRGGTAAGRGGAGVSRSHPRDRIRARRPSAAQAAARDIKNYIRTRHLRPGDLLPSEAELCEELGCSRSSIREAVRTLASLDIVEVRHGYGTYVSAMSLAPLVEGLVFRTVLDTDRSVGHLSYVVDTRKALDLAVGPELVRTVGTDSADGLHQIVAEMRERAAADESFADEDQRFHRVLLGHVDNPLIRELSDALWQVHMQVLPLIGVRTSEHIHQTIEAHADIVDAVVAGDLAAYERAVERHYHPLLEVLEARG